jgi:hypothetical protein
VDVEDSETSLTPPPERFSICPSLERNNTILTETSIPFRATSVEIACSNADDKSSGVSNTLPSST